MEVKKVKTVSFSGAGTTELVARLFAEACGVDVEQFDITPADAEVPSFGPGDLAVFAVPSFGGRVPAPALAKFLACRGDEVPAVFLVTYGNRAVDDTFVELADAICGNGFIPVGLGAIVAHHSLMTNVAQGRPDDRDRGEVARLAAAVMDKLQAADAPGDAALGEIPGSRPYRDYKGVPFHPIANEERCTDCGLCALTCPTGAIDPVAPSQTDTDLCVSCSRCIEVCPRGCRDFSGGVALAAARKAFAIKCAKRRESYSMV